MNIREAIAALTRRVDLTEVDSEAVMNEIMSGAATPAQVAAFLTALRMKGETVAEITGAAKVMRAKADGVKVPPGCILDTCGTGGDQLETFNISTTAAIVAAACGVTVAKHGNRSVSSRSGSADVLAALGVNIEAPKIKVEECLQKAGIGFLFAPLLHQAMKYAVGPRREIGIRTIFNILGPLTNPAMATHQLIGIYDGDLTEPIARVFKNLGTDRAMVVHGEEGLDEISLCGPTRVAELRDGEVKSYRMSPQDFGLKRCSLEDLRGGSPEQCAVIVRKVLGGEKGPKRDVVLLNSAAALYTSGSVESVAAGLQRAEQAIDSGDASAKLDLLVEVSNSG
ncbi:MAG TPA: anthranilate phosphoribosyltransferase [Candidatus Binatia bacterium]